MVITWQFGLDDPENSKNFRMIAEWWESLQAKDILWKQRLIPEQGNIDWSLQKFDETMTLLGVDVRGITFYWRKDETGGGGDITPSKLEFAPAAQRLYLYPETHKDLVISVEVAEPIAQKVFIEHPTWFSEKTGESIYQLVILDQPGKTEVRIEMDENSLNLLKSAICQLS